jgi:hypothetical protein
MDTVIELSARFYGKWARGHHAKEREFRWEMRGGGEVSPAELLQDVSRETWPRSPASPFGSFQRRYRLRLQRTLQLPRRGVHLTSDVPYCYSRLKPSTVRPSISAVSRETVGCAAMGGRISYERESLGCLQAGSSRAASFLRSIHPARGGRPGSTPATSSADKFPTRPHVAVCGHGFNTAKSRSRRRASCTGPLRCVARSHRGNVYTAAVRQRGVMRGRRRPTLLLQN